MIRIKGWIHILLLVCSLLLIAITHRGTAFGDMIFNALGIPAWSDGRQGIHYSTLFGIIMVIISWNLTVKYFRKHYKKYVGRTVFLSCVLFIYVFPLLTEQLYYLWHMRNTGIEAVDFLEKDSSCTYDTREDTVQVQCHLRLVNYGGNTELVGIRPILARQDDPNFSINRVFSFAEIQHQEVALEPRSNRMHYIDFISKPDERIAELSAGGGTIEFGVEFVKDGRQKEIYTY